MSDAEATAINVVSRMSDTELFDFQERLRVMVAKRKEKQFLKPMSDKELLKVLETSREQAEEGKTISREVARERVRAKYGV